MANNLKRRYIMTEEEKIELSDEQVSNDAQTSNTETELDELSKLKADLQEANDKFLRLYAEFDNYKRRTTKERAELLQTAGKEVILSFLPVIDDFERAMKVNADKQNLESFAEGVTLIHQKFVNTLHNKGLKPLESIGKEFNVDLHEAITKIPAPSEDLKGKIIDETEKGYTLNGHVVRFAKVIVGE
jgi:molecular chaperone GrpE